MLVVGHARQPGVKCHHDQGELQQGTEQAGSLPRESGLQIELCQEREGNKQSKQKNVVLVCLNLPKNAAATVLGGWL